MEPGRVIEIIEGQRFITALVTRVKGNRLLALSETDREISVSPNRVMHAADAGLKLTLPRDEQVRRLKELSTRRQQTAETIDLEDVWSLLEGEGEAFDYDFLAELVFPSPTTGDQNAAVIRRIFSDGLLFKMRPDRAERHSADKVEQIREAREKEAQRQRELAEGGRWLAEVWSNGGGDGPEGLQRRIVKALREAAVHGDAAPEYKWTQALLDQANLGGDPWRPFRLLVKMGEMGRHENLDLMREGANVEFPPEVQAEAESLARDQVWRDQPRRNLTDLTTITADSGGAKDFDDAVSLEVRGDRLILGVHIADVSAVAPPGGALDREAKERATSIYMPDQRIPMLPEVLSEECLSLKEGQDRPAFTMQAELTDEGEVLDFAFFPSLVRVKHQLSYQEVDGSVNDDPVLSRMYDLSQALKKQRTNNGALLLPLPKLNVFITPDGEIGVNLTYWENPGRAMISEFMILANHLAARMLKDLGAACYYRCQDPPSEVIVPPETTCEDLYPCLKQRNFLKRVTWRTEPKPHAGMGLSVYTNLTSPLRRYIDLVIQRQVRSVLDGNAPLYSHEELSEQLPIIETARRRAMRLQNRRRRYWLLLYLEAHPKTHPALVLERLPHRYRIYLTDLMMDADLPLQSGRRLEPGQEISVTVKKVNAREDILKFELA